MTDLTPITALGAAAPADHRLGRLRITENTQLALASLALHRGAMQPAPMGLNLPGPGYWAAGQGVAAFWSGPDQWMIETEGRAGEDFAVILAGEAPDCSVTEQTDGWAAFEIVSDAGGAPIRALMEKLVNLDAERFVPGSATRTNLHHMGVFLIRRAEDRLAIFGMRSFAGALWHVLAQTAERLEGALA
ncbi:MAG: sarcosine oxidase subunit gamma [Rhizobiaceae bacterium]